MGAHVSIAMYQRNIPLRYRLVGQRCQTCGGVNFPPRAVCSQCSKGTRFEDIQLSGRGVLYSWTRIAGAGAPSEFAAQAQALGSFVVGLVQLEEGPRVVAQIVEVGRSAPRLGQRVEAVLRRIYEEDGVIRYGYKFRPAGDAAPTPPGK
ncbi:MAG: Zn-ribbon domain-containing OB-fold protein [Acetobacteraceae bacterium]|nr:Zn-ribbon domain-containing OB-fold protein [Acetobacteraceae bacterium]